MRRRLILIAAVLAPFAQPAIASESAKEAAPTGQYVDLASVALPIVHQGRLINYVFATVRINLNNGVDAAALRAREPHFRDALVRVAHRTPFTRLDDFTVIDEAALRAAFTPEAVRIAGPRAVKGVQVLTQAPKQRSGLPRPPQLRGGAPRPAGQ